MNENMLTVPSDAIYESLNHFRIAGNARKERVVLWLQPLGSNRVSEVYVPNQEAEEDYFRIPPKSMSRLLSHLRHTDLKIAAQVHSHPKEAFHSSADDRWAIVRHRGALSIVVPFFGHRTTLANFRTQSALFALSVQNRWTRVPTELTSHYYGIAT
jgi:proteasome lid subunit RPN8/RPN11